MSEIELWLLTFPLWSDLLLFVIYSATVEPHCRSRMNVPFRIGGPDGDEVLEKKFLEEASKRGMIQLKGHR